MAARPAEADEEVSEDTALTAVGMLKGMTKNCGEALVDVRGLGQKMAAFIVSLAKEEVHEVRAIPAPDHMGVTLALRHNRNNILRLEKLLDSSDKGVWVGIAADGNRYRDSFPAVTWRNGCAFLQCPCAGPRA